VSVKVGAANGAVDVSQMITGIEWVVAHRKDDPNFPIKIIALAQAPTACSPTRSTRSRTPWRTPGGSASR
jgi:hypothetical protein